MLLVGSVILCSLLLWISVFPSVNDLQRSQPQNDFES